MYTVQPEVLEAVSDCARLFQNEIEMMAETFLLTIDGRFPALDLQVHPHFQATLEYALWAETGVIAVKAKLNMDKEDLTSCESVMVTMKFSLSCDPQTDVERKKERIEEILYGEAELFWGIQPAGHNEHIELTLSFQAKPGASRMSEYARCVLGIITGKMIAA
ncbi:hypothetical protein NDK47_08555 [Brevibacillus ruminantium]|uniref:Uncharacterized protein n=1 Tax=Brevibacillus ruminantium TaxID=2950604 RepID=A0ABY4WJU9_9BACL|nr:hypothetical protein [Brevibacillus ruminantium]USG67308.1 hypothetical protein NDK47_08555 [Brevibacillus ruminantium]